MKTAKELMGGKNLRVIHDEKVGGFIILADDIFITKMIGELVSQGVQGEGKFPLFGEFLHTITDATA